MDKRKLTDICNIQYGYPFDSALFSSSSDDGMPLIRIRDVKNGYSETYYKGDYMDDYIVHKGEYLIGMDGEFNIAAWKSDDALLNQRVCKISSNCNAVSTEYLYRYLTKELKIIEDETPCVTVKHLSARRLNQIYLIIPSLAEQERIVSELDLLSGIIDKQKAQLKELDNLAQSIFYDMFGDPVENEKGWEKKTLENIVSDDCSISYGIVQPGEDVENGIPVVRPIDLVHNIVRRKGLKRVSKDISDKYKRTILKGNELLFCVRGTTGVISYASSELQGCNVTRGITPLSFGEAVNRHYIFHYLNTKYMQAIIAENTRGIALKQINMKNVRVLPILLPVLPLQQLFAEKIGNIEKQKEAITRSIAETQQLFDSRMDYYFTN